MSLDLETVQTNIIYFDLTSEKLTTETLVKRLADKGIKMLALGPSRLRAVTHYGIIAEDINVTLKALHKIVKES